MSRKGRVAKRTLEARCQVAERSTAALWSVDRYKQKQQKGDFWLETVDRLPGGGRPLTAVEGIVKRRMGSFLAPSRG